jgi:hypothetical protein
MCNIKYSVNQPYLIMDSQNVNPYNIKYLVFFKK